MPRKPLTYARLSPDGKLVYRLDDHHDWGWQRRVADRLGVGESTISDILKGRRPMSHSLRTLVNEMILEKR